MKTRSLALFISIIMVMSLLVGCSTSESGNDNADSTPGESAVESKDEMIELTYWTLFGGGNGDLMTEMVDSFNETHANIQVKNVKLKWGEYYTKLITGVSSGKGPDIGISHTSKLPELVNQGIVTELDSVASLINVDWSEFNQNILDATIFDEKQYAVPLDTHPFIFFYNKKHLKSAGLLDENEMPIMENSAEGFVDFVLLLKEKLPEEIMPLSFPTKGDDPYRLWWALYHQLGGNDMISDDLKTASIDMEKAVQAASYMKDLYHKHKVIPLNLEEPVQMFQSESASLFMSGVWNTRNFEKIEDLEFGAMPIPAFYDSAATWGDSHTIILPITVNEDENRRKAAMIFANYIADQGTVWGTSGLIPSKTSVTDSEEFKKLPFRSEYVSVTNDVAFNKRSNKNWPIKDVVIRNLDTIWNNSTTPEDAFNKMNEDINKILK